MAMIRIYPEFEKTLNATTFDEGLCRLLRRTYQIVRNQMEANEEVDEESMRAHQLMCLAVIQNCCIEAALHATTINDWVRQNNSEDTHVPMSDTPKDVYKDIYQKFLSEDTHAPKKLYLYILENVDEEYDRGDIYTCAVVASNQKQAIEIATKQFGNHNFKNFKPSNTIEIAEGIVVQTGWRCCY